MTVSAKRLHRKSTQARQQGLDAARRIILLGGPSTVTLVNVGREVGTGHPNMIHHFGSATKLHMDLMEQMIQTLSTALSDVAAQSDTPQVMEPVNGQQNLGRVR